MGTCGDAELVVEKLLAIPKDDLLLVSVDAENGRLQFAVNVSFFKESRVAEGPFFSITDSYCLGE